MRLQFRKGLLLLGALASLHTPGVSAQNHTASGPRVVASCEPDFEREWNHHDLALGFITALNAEVLGAIGAYLRPGATIQDISTGEVVLFEEAPIEFGDSYVEVVGTLNGGNAVALSLRNTREPSENTVLLLYWAGGCIYGAAIAS